MTRRKLSKEILITWHFKSWRTIFSYLDFGLKPAVFGCLTNAIAPLPIVRPNPCGVNRPTLDSSIYPILHYALMICYKSCSSLVKSQFYQDWKRTTEVQSYWRHAMVHGTIADLLQHQTRPGESHLIRAFQKCMKQIKCSIIIWSSSLSTSTGSFLDSLGLKLSV